MRVLVVLPTYNEAANNREQCSSASARAAGRVDPRRRRQQPGRHGEDRLDVGERSGNVEVLSRPAKRGSGAPTGTAFAGASSEASRPRRDGLGLLPRSRRPRLARAPRSRLRGRDRLALRTRGLDPELEPRRVACSRGAATCTPILLWASGCATRRRASAPMRPRCLRRIDLSSVRADSYGFQIEMTYRAMQAGARITEVPIRFVDRELGTSKMSTYTVVEALVLVSLWGAERRPRAALKGRPPGRKGGFAARLERKSTGGTRATAGRLRCRHRRGRRSRRAPRPRPAGRWRRLGGARRAALRGPPGARPDRPGWGSDPRPAIGPRRQRRCPGGAARGRRRPRAGHRRRPLPRRRDRPRARPAPPERVGALVLIGSVGVAGALSGFDRLLAVPMVGTGSSVPGSLPCAAASSPPRATPSVTRAPASRRRWRRFPTLRAVIGRTAGRSCGRSRQSFLVEQRALLAETPALERRLAHRGPDRSRDGRHRTTSCPPRRHAPLAGRIPGAELIVMAGGHLLPFERPEMIAAIVRRYSDASPRPSGTNGGGEERLKLELGLGQLGDRVGVGDDADAGEQPRGAARRRWRSGCRRATRRRRRRPPSRQARRSGRGRAPPAWRGSRGRGRPACRRQPGSGGRAPTSSRTLGTVAVAPTASVPVSEVPRWLTLRSSTIAGSSGTSRCSTSRGEGGDDRLDDGAVLGALLGRGKQRRLGPAVRLRRHRFGPRCRRADGTRPRSTCGGSAAPAWRR